MWESEDCFLLWLYFVFDDFEFFLCFFVQKLLEQVLNLFNFYGLLFYLLGLSKRVHRNILDIA